MSDWQEMPIRRALADRLGEIAGMQVSPIPKTNPTPPSGMIFGDGITYDDANMGGLDGVPYTVRLLVGLAEADAGYDLLAEYVGRGGSASIKAKLEEGDNEGQPTLGGLVNDLRVTSVSPEQLFTFEGGGPYLGRDWTVVVYA